MTGRTGPDGPAGRRAGAQNSRPMCSKYRRAERTTAPLASSVNTLPYHAP